VRENWPGYRGRKFLEKVLVKRIRREKRAVDWKDSIYYYLRSRVMVGKASR